MERDHQQDAGQDTAWLDRLIRELEPAPTRRCPYPPEDLAALTGVDVAGVQRALDEMVRAGLAAKGDTPPADEA